MRNLSEKLKSYQEADEDLEIKDEKELEEAKKAAGVKTHKQVLEDAESFGRLTKDDKLVASAKEKLWDEQEKEDALNLKQKKGNIEEAQKCHKIYLDSLNTKDTDYHFLILAIKNYEIAGLPKIAEMILEKAIGLQRKKFGKNKNAAKEDMGNIYEEIAEYAKKYNIMYWE